MFNWLRKTDKNNSRLKGWNINDIDGFKRIHNNDSIQYVNEDTSKVIYFSVLTISGGNVFQIGDNIGTTIKEDADGWHLKGFKKHKNKVLVCVITVKEKNDITLATDFINSITSHKDDE